LAAIIEFVNDLSTQVTALAWGMFLLAWSIGWVIRGSPIPFLRVKRAGQGLIEDALWAAFWLAMGTTIFSLISYLVSVISIDIPSP
jgi:hypothetical protein